MSSRSTIESPGSSYAQLLEAIPDAAIVVNRAGEIVLANLKAMAMFGYQRGELAGRSLQILVPEAARSHHTRDVDRYFANPQVRPLGVGLRLSARRRDGSEFPVDIMLSPIVEGDEQFALGVIRDKTSTDWSQLALLQSDTRYRSLFDNMFEGVAYCRMLFDEDQRPQDFIYLEVNTAFETLTGLTAVVGKRVTEVIPGIRESNPELFEIYGRVALTGQPERFEARLEPLGFAWLAVSVYSTEREYFVAVFENITERKRAEDALRASEERYRGLFEGSPIALWEEDLAAVKQRLEALQRAGHTDLAAYLGQHPETVAECVGLIRILDVNSAALKLYRALSKADLLGALPKIVLSGSNETLLSELVNIASGQTSFQLEGPFHTLTGEQVYVSLRRSALPGYGQTLGRVIVSAIDITESQHAAEALRISEEKFRSIIEQSSEGIVLLDEHGKIVEWNHAQEQITGIPRPQAIGAPFADIQFQMLPPERRTGRSPEFFRKALADAFQTGQVPPLVATNEIAIQTVTGAGKTILQAAFPIKTEQGYRVGALVRDITDRKQAEEALRASEERYRTIFQTAAVSIWEEDFSAIQTALDDLRAQGVTDFSGYLAGHPEFVRQAASMVKVRDVNDTTLRMLGAKDKVELLGALDQIIVPEALKSLRDEIVAIAEGRAYFEGETLNQTLDGRRINLWLTMAVPAKKEQLNSVLVSIIDITERKRAEAALRDSEAKFRSYLESAPMGVFVVDQSGRFIEVNPATARMLGYAGSEFAGTSILTVFPPQFQETGQQFFDRVARDGSVTGEMQVRRKDGTLFWISAEAVRLVDNRIMAFCQDITQRKQAEEALAQERNLLRTLIDNVPDFIYAKDAASRFTLVNRASASSLGRTPDEVVGRTDFDLHPPELAAQFLADEQAVMQSGQALLDREEMMYENGQERWQLTTTVPLRDGSGQVTGLVGISRNITARRQGQAALQQRLAELEAVNRISKALRVAQTLDEMLPVWLDVTLALMHATGGSVWLYDPGKDELRPAVIRGWTQPARAEPVPPQKPGVGVNGYVFVTGQPYVSGDFKKDPLLAPGIRERIPPGGGAGVPIRVGDNVIGTFVVNLTPGRAITPSEVNLLVTLAEIAGSAIHRMRLFEQTTQRLDQITTLRAIDVAITASLDVRVTLDVFLDQVVQQLGVHAADVLLLEPASRMLQYAAGRGFRTRDFEQVRQLVGEGRAGRVALERRMTVISELGASDRPGRRTASLQQEGFVSYWGMPLIAKGQVLGVLELFHRAPLQTNAEWLQFLETLAGQAAIALENARLFDNLQKANQRLVMAYDATIAGWSAALDLRDHETEGHTQRVTDLTERLARVMGLRADELVHIRRGALLHDIGKMGIPDAILLKTGPLTDEEWAIMRQHPTYAYRLLAPINYLRPALEIPYCHHEKWDGTGYPRGLSGEKIPLSARVFAVVDVWDALRSDRPYRAAWSADRVREHIRAQAGTHFDPPIVKVALQSDLLIRHDRD